MKIIHLQKMEQLPAAISAVSWTYQFVTEQTDAHRST